MPGVCAKALYEQQEVYSTPLKNPEDIYTFHYISAYLYV